MDSMVKTVMSIEREMENTQSVRHVGISGKKKESCLLPVRGRSGRLLVLKNFRDKASTTRAKAKLELPVSLDW